MSGQDKSFERINQKRRTRAELLRAARQLTEDGHQPSVAEVADHAGISRATAYRYFSKPEELIREVLFPCEGMLIATKAGFARPRAGVWEIDGDPGRLRQEAIRSCDKLGLEQIGERTVDGIEFDFDFGNRPSPPDAKGLAKRSQGGVIELIDDGSGRHNLSQRRPIAGDFQ